MILYQFYISATVELLAHNFVKAVLFAAFLDRDDTEGVESCLVYYFWAYPLIFLMLSFFTVFTGKL